jgi:NAD(P)-dependent dehydrogenase (short-subunit alcohol dehydrogenase family)
MSRFENKTALVTGAAAGIGRATALRLAEEGAALFLTDVVPDGLEETGKLVSALGADVETRHGDVSDEADVASTVAACIERFSRLDALCNVAGILRWYHTTEITFAQWRQVLSINLDGTFLMCRAALPHLLETRGRIVNVGSTAGLKGLPYGVAYSASKGGVQALTRALAVEFASRGLRVNSISPASITTGMTEAGGLPDAADFKLLLRMDALDGPRDPATVAALIAFLASDEAEHINGEDIRIDGAALA